MRELFRFDPALPAAAYKTYQIVSPLATHWRDGTCEEAGCLAHHHGWRTLVDESTELGQRQAHYIRTSSGRRFVEQRTPSGTEFTFEPGQRCFAAPHKVPLQRPEIYLVRGGDWRGNPRGTPTLRHSGPDAWVDDFASHQDKLGRAMNG